MSVFKKIVKKTGRVVFFSLLLGLVLTSCASNNSSAGRTEEKQPLVLYVVRHGQSVFNLMDRVQGISDAILTERGMQGAINMGIGLRDINFRSVYASDLARAYRTAALAMEQNRATQNWTVIQMPELREVSFGIFEGDPNYMMYYAFGKDLGLNIPEDARDIYSASAPILEQFDNSFMRFFEELANFNKRVDTEFRVSESADEVYARLKKGIDTIIAENPNGGNIMLVAHGQSINFLFRILNVDTAGAPLGNSSVTKIKYENGVFSVDGPIGDMSYVEAGAELGR